MSRAGTSGKKGKGKQKIEMKKINNENNLQVAFSKRRSGLFKKASELCTLCGANLALIVFSPSDKVFSFGHPNVGAIIQRYLSQAPHETSNTMLQIEAQQRDNVCELNTQLFLIKYQLDANKKRGEELECLLKEEQARIWWAGKVEEMKRPHLEQFRVELNKLKNHVTCCGVGAAGTNPPNHQFFDVGGGPTNTMIPFNHAPLPLPQVFPQQFFLDPMSQPHNLFDYNNMGGYGDLPGFF